ncbi:DUF4249 domain-containing protein [Bacteroidia bacterium]|jgi:hypothetical protein|nr:DUF4249 domain-containing protein [Bacteroidia bacterium]CAI8243207.1 MAG: Uncharacterised protein [Bacteroidia bacterium]
MKKYLSIVLTIFIAGCYQDTIRPDLLQEYRNKMVVTSILTSGKPANLILTNSLSAIDTNSYRSIQNANIEIETSSVPKQRMTNVPGDTNYVSNVIGNAGESLSIKIKHSDFNLSVSSTVAFPVSVGATANLTVDGGLDTSGLPGDLIQIAFNDPSNQSNYYRLKIYYLSQTTGIWIPLAFTKSDPSLTGYNSYILNDASVIFSDELFNGSNKVISTVAPSGIVSSNTGDKYKVEFSHISNDFFEYYRSLQRAQDSKEISFQGGYNNAVVVHTNIKNGLGILATQTSTTTILK